MLRDGDRYVVCGLVTMLTGEGAKATGVVGVSWGEKLKWNSGMKVSSNTVNRKTATIWGILVALGVASARGYERIMVATENPDFARGVFRELEEGKLEGSEAYAGLVRKYKEYKARGVTAVAPDANEIAGIKSSNLKVLEDAKKIAKKTFEAAKKEAKP